MSFRLTHYFFFLRLLLWGFGIRYFPSSDRDYKFLLRIQKETTKNPHFSRLCLSLHKPLPLWPSDPLGHDNTTETLCREELEGKKVGPKPDQHPLFSSPSSLELQCVVHPIVVSPGRTCQSRSSWNQFAFHFLLQLFLLLLPSRGIQEHDGLYSYPPSSIETKYRLRPLHKVDITSRYRPFLQGKGDELVTDPGSKSGTPRTPG